jgi:hypothetical protein
MHLESPKGYVMPKMASFYEVNMPTSKPVDIVVDNDGKVGLSLCSPPFLIDLKKFLSSIPDLTNKHYWLLEEKWAAVLFAELDTPLFFNSSAKKICLLCNGSNTVTEILTTMVHSYPKPAPEGIMTDTINFLYLLKKFRLIRIKNNPS